MGITEILLILVIALILFGPEDLPEIARKLGKISYEIRKATNEVTKEFKGTIDSPRNLMNKAFEETTMSLISEPKKQTNDKPIDKTIENNSNKNLQEDTLLTYEDEPSSSKEPLKTKEEDDPLSELPSGMVSYEEKGASR